MKKLIIVAAAALLAVSANAQTYFNAGYGLCSDINAITGMETEVTGSNAVFAGVSHNFGIAGKLGVEPGVNWFFNFSKEGDDMGYRNAHHGIQIPVLLNYAFAESEGIAFKVFAGPAVNFGISDKTTTFVGKETGYTIDNYEDDSYSRLGLSASLGLAAELKGFRIKLGYDFGLTDLNNADYFTFKQNMFSASLGIIL